MSSESLVTGIVSRSPALEVVFDRFCKEYGLGAPTVWEEWDLVAEQQVNIPQCLLIDGLCIRSSTLARLSKLAALPSFHQTRAVLVAGPTLLPEFQSSLKDSVGIALLEKPFTFESLLQAFETSQPLSALKSLDPNMMTLAEASKKIDSTPGINAHFRWSSTGTLAYATNDTAKRFSDAMIFGMELSQKIGQDFGFGQLVELSLWGPEQSTTVFSALHSEDGDGQFSTWGILAASSAPVTDLAPTVRAWKILE